MSISVKLCTIFFAFTLMACHTSPHPVSPSLQEVAISEEAAAPLGVTEYEVNKSKIIRNGTLQFTTDQFDKCSARVADTLKRFGGFISDEKENKSSYEWRNEMVAKVPSANLEACMAALSTIALSVEEKTMNSEDCTGVYIDTDARLKAQQVLESRYLELLKKADKVSDMMEIEEKLSAVRASIEAMQSRLKQIDADVKNSTLKIVYTQAFKRENTNRPSFLSQTGDAVREGWNSLKDTILAFISYWPFLILIAFIFTFIRRWRKRRKARKASNVNL